jgi:CheY-like chemotaxis protein
MSIHPILHIEDNFHNRRLVRKILASQGYPLTEAEDGLTGLQLVRDLHPSLILLDIGLPGLDGIGVMQRVKQEPTLARIPVVAITAHAMYGQREHFLALGFDDYLAKPLQPMDLLALVKGYLNEREWCR